MSCQALSVPDTVLNDLKVLVQFAKEVWDSRYIYNFTFRGTQRLFFCKITIRRSYSCLLVRSSLCSCSCLLVCSVLHWKTQKKKCLFNVGYILAASIEGKGRGAWEWIARSPPRLQELRESQLGGVKLGDPVVATF